MINNMLALVKSLCTAPLNTGRYSVQPHRAQWFLREELPFDTEIQSDCDGSFQRIVLEGELTWIALQISVNARTHTTESSDCFVNIYVGYLVLLL